MDAGEYIGVGIQGVCIGHQGAAEVLPGHHRRTQILAVGHQGAEERGRAEGQDQHPDIAAEALRVLYQEIEPQDQQDRTPGHIQRRKVLAEGDVLVDGRLGGPIMIGDKMLDGKKCCQIAGQKQPPPNIGVLPDKGQQGLFHKTTPRL